MSIIDMHNVHLKYRNKSILDSINLKIDKNCVFALLGYNGMGKSSLIDILTDAVKPTEGQVKVFNGSFSDARERIGVLYERFTFFGFLSVEEIISYMLVIRDVEKNNSDTDFLTKSLGLDKIWKRQFRFLSKGEQKKVGIIISLMKDPSLLILDEPTADLDPFVRDICWNLFKQKHRTVFFTTHLWEEAESHADQIAFIYEGRITNIDSPESFLSEKYLPFEKVVTLTKREELSLLLSNYTFIEEGGQYHIYTNEEDVDAILGIIKKRSESYMVTSKTLKDIYLFLTQNQHKVYEKH